MAVGETCAVGMKFGGFPAAFAIGIACAAVIWVVVAALIVFEIFVDFAVAVVILSVAQFLREGLRRAIAPCESIAVGFLASLASLTNAGLRRDDAISRHSDFIGIARARRTFGDAMFGAGVNLAQIAVGAAALDADLPRTAGIRRFFVAALETMPAEIAAEIGANIGVDVAIGRFVADLAGGRFEFDAAYRVFVRIGIVAVFALFGDAGRDIAAQFARRGALNRRSVVIFCEMGENLIARGAARAAVVDVDVSVFIVDKRLVDETVAVIVDAVAEFAFGRDGIAIPIVEIVFIFGANPSPDARADVANGVFGADFVGFGIDGNVGIGGIDETVAIVVDSVANFGLGNSCVAFAPFVAVFGLLAVFPSRAGTEFVGIVARNAESDFSRTAIARIADGDALAE